MLAESLLPLWPRGPTVSYDTDPTRKLQGAPQVRRLGKLRVMSALLQNFVFLKANVGQWSLGLCSLSSVPKGILWCHVGLCVLDTPILGMTLIFLFLFLC